MVTVTLFDPSGTFREEADVIEFLECDVASLAVPHECLHPY